MTKQEAFELFQEWHLDTYFVPYNPKISCHQERCEGFMGALGVYAPNVNEAHRSIVGVNLTVP